MNLIVVGHRGAAALEPENTLRGFRRACDLGVDQVELDVRLTRDGELVCLHDASLHRTTGSPALAQEMTLEEIRKLDAGLGERVPILQEAVAAVRGRAILEIELKAEGTAEVVLALIGSMNLGHQEYILTSFNAAWLQFLRGQDSELLLGLISVTVHAL